MAKPNNLFRWATGINVNTEPAEAKKTAGWIFSERPPPKMMNWLFNGAFQWHSYLDNLHNEPEFLNKDYTWLGSHTFNGQRVVVNTTTEFNGTFTRFNNISPQLNGGNTEWLYTNARSKAMLLPLPPQVSLLNNAGAVVGAWIGGNGWVYTDDSDCDYTAEIQLPTGCVLTGFVVHGHTRGTPGLSGLNFRAGLYRSTPRWLAGGAPEVVPLIPETMTNVSGAGFGNEFLLGSSGTIAEVVNRNLSKYFVGIRSSGGAAMDSIYAVMVSFLDPGPRNG